MVFHKWFRSISILAISMIENMCCMRLHLPPFFSFFSVVLLYHYNSCCSAHTWYYEITNLLQNVRYCMSVCVCLRETEIEQSHLWYFKLFWFWTFYQCFIQLKSCFILYLSKHLGYLPSPSFRIPLSQWSGVPCDFFFFTFLKKWLVLISFSGFEHLWCHCLRDFLKKI